MSPPPVIFEAPVAHEAPTALTHPCMASLATPPGLGIHARDMTRLQARDVVVYLAAHGAITLGAGSPVRFGPNCAVVTPAPATRITLQPATVCGVRWVNRVNRRITSLTNLDVRTVVVIARLSAMLRTHWGATEIHHLGVGQGRGSSHDCHNTGRAIDFAGVVGVIDGQPYAVDVLADWGQQPVVMPDGRHLTNWPSDYRATTYRLAAAGRPIARDIFRDVYDLAAHECTDTSPARGRNATIPTTIGRASRFILHPDYPNPAAWGRPAHRNHIHMQIGPTGQEVTPP